MTIRLDTSGSLELDREEDLFPYDGYQSVPDDIHSDRASRGAPR